jgi:hypothetical protein
VDEADYWNVAGFDWLCFKTGYAGTRIGGTWVTMHRMLLLPDPKMEVDHINGDRLDNRRCNLRVCTRAQNSVNARRWNRNRVGYKGVYRPNAGRPGNYQARIYRNGKAVSLGLFADPIDAALAYDLAAIEADGEFARPTFLRRG